MAKKPTAPPSSMGDLVNRLTKEYGDGRVVRRDKVRPYDIVPTGSLTLDLATRTGGWIRGRMHEIVGPEGSGKTTLCITSMVEAQHLYPDRAVGYIDMEQTFDYDWAEGLGLETSKDRWLHIYPDDSEDVSDQLRKMCDTGFFSVLVVDSIGGMESKEAFTKDAEDKVMGRNAQVITRMAKHCAVLARRNNVAVLFVNQLRANLNGGHTDISAGPKAMKYATTMKVQMAEVYEEAANQMRLKVDGDSEQVGRHFRGKVSRNKVAPAGKSGDFWIINQDTDEFGPIGIDRADEAVTVGINSRVIQQGGGWYTIPGDHKFQGRYALKQHLRSDLTAIEEIREKALGIINGEVAEETEIVFEEAK